MFSKRVCAAAGAVLGAALAGCGPEPTAERYPTEPSPALRAAGPATVAAGVPRAGRVGREPGLLRSGDWLEVAVGDGTAGAAKATAVRRVAADGTIPLQDPAAGGAGGGAGAGTGRVKVAGLSAGAAEAAVSDAYRRADLVYNAVVTVRRVRLARADERADGRIGRFDLVRVDVRGPTGATPAGATPAGATPTGATQAATPTAAVVRRVDAGGMFDVPMVGRVRLAGDTEAAAASAVAEAYRQVLNGERVQATVTLLEPAPANADRMDLPDEPLDPVPPALTSTFYPTESAAAAPTATPPRPPQLQQTQPRQPQPPAVTASVALPPSSLPPSSLPPSALSPSRPTTRPGVYEGGDTLEVTVPDLLGRGKPLVVAKRVAFDGTLAVPMLDPVPVAGLTGAKAEAAADAAYRKANLLSDPRVSIRRLAVAQPGDPAVGPIHRYDLLRVNVGDLTGGGGDAPAVTRRVDAAGEFAVPGVGGVKVADLSEGQAAVAIADRYRRANPAGGAVVDVTIVEPAPPDAARRDLPDVPVGR